MQEWKIQVPCLQGVDAWFLVYRHSANDRLIPGLHFLNTNALYTPNL